MRAHSPSLPSPTTAELRALWRAYSDPQVRCAILELVRLRSTMYQVDQLYEAINAVWRQDTSGNLVALEHLKSLVYDERARSGRLPSAGSSAPR